MEPKQQTMRTCPRRVRLPVGTRNRTEFKHVFIQQTVRALAQSSQVTLALDQLCVQLADFARSPKRATLPICTTAAKIKYNAHH